jgi:hypothetical protein
VKLLNIAGGSALILVFFFGTLELFDYTESGWTSYSPKIVASSSGAAPPTFTLKSARYRRASKTTISVRVDLIVADAGTGSGTINIPLPVSPAAAFRSVGVGACYSGPNFGRGATALVEINDTKMAVQGVGPDTFMVTGNAIVVDLTYEVL